MAKELVNEDEFEVTKDRVEEFRRNEGPKLQKYLQEKYVIHEIFHPFHLW